jgi:radical SAM protein with 4Fe4S-binding SPASM domain
VIVRYEPWGAWVKLESIAALSGGGALVAIDREGARALGLDGGALWAAAEPRPSAPLEVHVAVTSRCAAGCESCYLDARPDGIEPPRAAIERTLDALATAGVFTVAFGGGEPTLRDDLGDIADAARARGLTPVVTTSGLGVGDKKLSALTRFAQVNVSYDGDAGAYARVRGFDGAAAAESTIRRLAHAGVEVGVNVVLTRSTFDNVPRTLRRAHELGAREAQLLRLKPAGRARSLDYLARRLSPEQARAIGPLLRSLARELPEMRIRIDCALVPFLSADREIASRPEELARWGVLGCEAGAALAATRVDGRVAPCSFAGPSAIDATEIAGRGWAEDPLLHAFRSFSSRAPEPCASCTLAPICRGGCKVVTSFVDRARGPSGDVPDARPDPECPRVHDLGSDAS